MWKTILIIQAVERANQTAELFQQEGHNAPMNFARSHRKTPSTPKVGTQPKTDCYRCGGQHKQQDCWFREVNCNSCGKGGHIARVCHSKVKPQKKPWQKATHNVTEEVVEELLNHVENKTQTPCVLDRTKRLLKWN